MSAFESPFDLGRLAIVIEEYPSPVGPLEVDVVSIADVVSDVLGAGHTFSIDEGAVVVGRLGDAAPELFDGFIAHLGQVLGGAPTPLGAGSLPTPMGTTAIRATGADGNGFMVYLGADVISAPAAAAPAGGGASGGLINLGMLREVPLEVTAELGRTRLPVADILQLNVGSVVNLDRAAGSPVDLVVNGTLIAHGEVVVIDDEYGVRITEILGRVSDSI